MEFTRSSTFCESSTAIREQINGATAFVDASSVYGSEDEDAINLRIVFQRKINGWTQGLERY